MFEGGGGGGGATGLLNKGGVSNRLPVEFPQVQASTVILLYSLLSMSPLYTSVAISPAPTIL